MKQFVCSTAPGSVMNEFGVVTVEAGAEAAPPEQSVPVPPEGSSGSSVSSLTSSTPVMC